MSTSEPEISFLEAVRVRGVDYPWRPLPIVLRLLFGLSGAAMVFVSVVNFMRADPFTNVFLLLAVGFFVLGLWDTFPSRLKIRVTDTSLQFLRGEKLRYEIRWSELVSNAKSYRLKGSVKSADGKRRIWLYTRSIRDVVPEQLYQLTDWVSDHRDDIRRAERSLTGSISNMLSSAGVTFRPNSPDENIELGVTAVLGASAALLLTIFPIRSWLFWALAVGSVLAVAIPTWLAVSYPRRRRVALTAAALRMFLPGVRKQAWRGKRYRVPTCGSAG